jgi:pyruvate dehydrogenase E2 component (dihydrolipoamide acetyltransferase)
MRKAIASAMARSKREIPHYYLATNTSLRAALGWLERRNSGRGPQDRVLPVTLFVKAVALAAREFPEFSGHWVEGTLRPSEAVHVGLAISLRGGGLVAPAIRDTDRRSLEELGAAVADLVQRAREGRLRSSELTEATLTVTSLGDRGVETVFGVIYPPQVALVGFGRVVERPWAGHGGVGVTPVVQITLSGDHRATDGHRGGLFLQDVADRLQHPEDL